jgi:hypothetical protein
MQTHKQVCMLRRQMWRVTSTLCFAVIAAPCCMDWGERRCYVASPRRAASQCAGISPWRPGGCTFTCRKHKTAMVGAPSAAAEHAHTCETSWMVCMAMSAAHSCYTASFAPMGVIGICGRRQFAASKCSCAAPWGQPLRGRRQQSRGAAGPPSR